MTGKTFTDTENKKNLKNKANKSHPLSDWDCHTGNPVIIHINIFIAIFYIVHYHDLFFITFISCFMLHNMGVLAVGDLFFIISKMDKTS